MVVASQIKNPAHHSGKVEVIIHDVGAWHDGITVFGKNFHGEVLVSRQEGAPNIDVGGLLHLIDAMGRSVSKLLDIGAS